MVARPYTVAFLATLLVMLVGALGPAVSPASAFSILAGDGGSFVINWSDPAHNLAATATFFVDIVSATEIHVEIKLTNTSTDATARLTGIGFGIDPDATTVGQPTEALGDPAGFGIFATDADQIDTSRTGVNFPSFGTLEICTDVDASGSCGSGSGGLTPGQVDAFVINLTGTWGTQLEFDSPFGLKFASVASLNDGSIELAGTPGGGGGGPIEIIPAPATLLLFGSGLLGLRLLGRRRK